MKKILFIIYSYSKGGGAESLLTSIVNNLDPKKYEISIIEVEHDYIKIEPSNNNIKILPYICSVDEKRPRKNIHDLYFDPQRVFNDYIGDKYDLYVSFNYQLPSFLLPDNRHTVAWIHTCIYDLAKKEMERYYNLQKDVFERAERIVSISDITTQSICDLYPSFKEKIVEIYNGLDIDAVRKKAEEKADVNLERESIIYIGRLEERKDPERLYSIFSKLHLMDKKYHLYFLGYGSLKDKIEDMSRQEGFESYVHFLGYLQNPFPVIRQARVCVMTSKEEGFPMSLMECQALGVPFVSTVVGGARILAMDSYCGTVIENNDEAVRAIVYYMEQCNIELVKEHCQESILRFSLKAYIKRIEDFFDSLLGG